LPARIKRLMQKDEEVGKLSATVPVIAARALEQFLEELITKTASITTSLQAKTLTPEHIRQHIYNDPRLSFLHDLANRMATGPNTTAARSLSTSSAVSSPTPSTTSRPSFQSQLSIPYQDPPTLPSACANSTNSTNLLYVNQQLSRTYSKSSYCGKVKSNKRTFDLVNDDEEDDDDEDDDDEDDDDEGDQDDVRNQRLVANHQLT